MKDLGRGEAEQVSDCQQEEMKLALETADRFHLACTKTQATKLCETI